jgi:hypothetical protein
VAHAVRTGKIARNPCEGIDGFGSSFNKAKIDAGMSERDIHFNDLRGTAATKF